MSDSKNNIFFSDPKTISSGSTTLKWSVPCVTSVTIKDQTGKLVGTFAGSSGSTAVSPTSTTRYDLTATVGAGTTSLSTTVQVSSSSGLVFTTSNSTIAKGQTATIQWNVPNAT